MLIIDGVKKMRKKDWLNDEIKPFAESDFEIWSNSSNKKRIFTSIALENILLINFLKILLKNRLFSMKELLNCWVWLISQELIGQIYKVNEF
jgi:hypothetical protein